MTKKILVIDDEEDVALIIKYILQKHGYVAIHAQNGKEALELAKKEDLLLALIDYYLPDTKGNLVGNALRKIPGKKDLPMIFISASQEALDTIPLLKQSLKLTKPIFREQLIPAVEALIAPLPPGGLE